jgi:Ohr subfamily peroxiredoxin
MKILYTAESHVDGGRNGHARSSDDRLDVDLSVPESLGGDGGPGTNPEQLFAAGYGACFLGAVTVAAQHRQVEVPAGMSVDATVGLGTQPDGAYNIEVELTVSLPGIDRDLALAIVEAAHETCPYSNATRGNVDVRLAVADA